MGALRVLDRHLRVFRRTWLHSIMFNVIEPLLYLWAMGFGLGAFVPQMDGVSYLQFIAPGMVALSAMYSASFECTYGTFVRLHYQKTFQAMLAGPVTAKDVILGEILYGTFKSVIFGTVILGIVALLDQIKSFEALAIPLLLVLNGTVFAVLAMCFTAVSSSIDYLNYYITLVVLPFLLFGGLYFPVSALPYWLQLFNWINPLYHSVTICRALALGQASTDLWMNIAVLLLLGGVSLPYLLKQMEKKLIY